MNKQLLLSLYDRSGLGAYMPVDFKGHELQVEEHMEKFAELIVRECTSLTLDYKNSEHYRGWLDYRNEIRKHFGVEE